MYYIIIYIIFIIQWAHVYFSILEPKFRENDSLFFVQGIVTEFLVCFENLYSETHHLSQIFEESPLKRVAGWSFSLLWYYIILRPVIRIAISWKFEESFQSQFLVFITSHDWVQRENDLKRSEKEFRIVNWS